MTTWSELYRNVWTDDEYGDGGFELFGEYLDLMHQEYEEAIWGWAYADYLGKCLDKMKADDEQIYKTVGGSSKFQKGQPGIYTDTATGHLLLRVK